MEKQNNNLFKLTRALTYKQLMSNPILDIAARFWEKERYNAFKILYRSFRIIDDLVDNKKSIKGNFSLLEKNRLNLMIDTWIKTIENRESKELIQKHLFETIKKYEIPLWPWKSFSKSMIYDFASEFSG